jgi:hypothetical protein
MFRGQFAEAWKESDRISRKGGDRSRLWNGKSLKGKRVIIRCLHGYGDVIQFIRYARLVGATASTVIVQTQPELVRLLRGVPFVDKVISWDGEDRNQWDQQVEAMELPHLFRTTLDTIPNEVPYIHVPLVDRQNARIPASRDSGRPRIGLQWRSGLWDQSRSMELRDLEPVLAHRQCDWYSFQRGCVDVLPAHLQDVSGESPHIVEVAADLLHIDLLITVDTMLAHLAGALSRPVWVFLPYAADWRWMLARRDSPWYPTMRLYRQPRPGDWTAAVHELREDLHQWLTSGSANASSFLENCAGVHESARVDSSPGGV